MIDIFTDNLIPMKEVPAMLGLVDGSSVDRWWQHGVQGVKLETVKVGKTRYTTKEALAEFCRQRAERKSTATTPALERSPEMTERLKRAGLL